MKSDIEYALRKGLSDQAFERAFASDTRTKHFHGARRRGSLVQDLRRSINGERMVDRPIRSGITGMWQPLTPIRNVNLVLEHICERGLLSSPSQPRTSGSRGVIEVQLHEEA